MSFQNVTLTTIYFALIALISALALAMPRLTRRELFFAVTVRADFRDGPVAKRILRSYYGRVATAAALAVGLAGLGVARGSHALPIAALLAMAFLQSILLVSTRRQVLPYSVAPSSVREASAARRTGLPGGLLLQAGPFLVLAVAVALLAASWDQIPARFPVHFDANGVPNRWIDKSVVGVFWALLPFTAITAMLVALAHVLHRYSRPVRVQGPSGKAEGGFRRAMVLVVLGSAWAESLTFAALLLAPLYAPDRSPARVVLAVGAMAIAATTLLVIWVARMGQGGSRLAAPAPDASGKPVGDRTADANWKWGLFYVNRDDPALFIEKRFGIGYTLNFGNAWSWLVLIGLPAALLTLNLLTR